MTIIRIDPKDIETYGIVMRPSRTFSTTGFDQISGTYADVTGSVHVYDMRSRAFKDVFKQGLTTSRTVFEGDTTDVIGTINAARHAARVSGSNFNQLLGLLQGMQSIDRSGRLDTSVDIERIQPGAFLDHDMLVKRHIREVLFPY